MGKQKMEGKKTKLLVEKINSILRNEKAFSSLVDDAFNMIDKDKSGQISLVEIEDFVDYMIEEMKVPMDPEPGMVEEFMKRFDKDNSGSISKGELKPALRALVEAWRDYLIESEQ
eukprot:TRINITY_DN28863_c0_g1_i1.p2 TRINITY_DN28863_c0_g1~~TRINITY_DN28863_c0_g1_i1.p2  ORF type:complete len:115 (+),score=27.59 TRINITY_DN28863_c0_g1_i1:167-511(+)